MPSGRAATIPSWQRPQGAAEGAKAIGQRTPALWHCAKRARALPKRQSWPIATAAPSSGCGRPIVPPRCKNPALSEIIVSGTADCPFCSASSRWQLPPAVPCSRQRTASYGKSGGAATGFSNPRRADRAQRPMGANGQWQLPPPPVQIAASTRAVSFGRCCLTDTNSTSPLMRASRKPAFGLGFPQADPPIFSLPA